MDQWVYNSLQSWSLIGNLLCLYCVIFINPTKQIHAHGQNRNTKEVVKYVQKDKVVDFVVVSSLLKVKVFRFL